MPPFLHHLALADDGLVVGAFTSAPECAAYCRLLGFFHLPTVAPVRVGSYYIV